MQPLRTALFCTAIVVLAMAPASANGPQEKKEVNLGFFNVYTHIDTREVGLPAYPGSSLHKNDRDEDSSAKVWAGLGRFGFKVAVVELDSSDDPAKIAGYYQPMLGKFGKVINCSYGAPKPAVSNDDILNCKDDHVKPGEFLFKAGRQHEVHIVGIQREGTKSKIALVSLDWRGFGD